MQTTSFLCVGFVASLALAGCGDDEGTGGGGGSTTSSTTSVGTSTSTTGSTTSTSATITSTSASTSTGMVTCDALDAAFDMALTDTSWSADITPNIGGPEPDYLILAVPEGSMGTIDLEQLSTLAGCGDTETCVFVLQDFVDPNPPAKVYAADAGTIELDGTTTAGAATGTLASVALTEVELNAQTCAISELAGGACLTLEAASFDFP